MLGFSSSNHLKFLCSVSFALLSLILVTAPTAVVAHAGHGDEFHNSSEASQPTDSIQVDAETAKRIGIKIEPVKRQQLAVGIKTTGQIETLPHKKIEVKAPVDGTLVELLVKPGYKVSKGQPVAILSSLELASLRVESALTSALGLFPLVVEGGPGKEILQPLSIVVLGGLFTSTALTLLVLPALYAKFGKILIPSRDLS